MSCVTPILDKSIEAFARLQDELRNEPQRHRSEVKLLAGLETHGQRAVYIEGDGGVRETRGDEAADRLRRDVWDLLKAGGVEAEPMQESLL